MDPYPAKDVLNTLLAVEALLVAASTLAAAVGSAPVAAPALKNFVPQKTAYALFFLMVLVAAGGVAAWIQIYLGDPSGVDEPLDVVQAGALLAGLVAIPIFGFQAARWAGPS